MGLSERMREVWMNYMQFILQCAGDETLKRDFLNDPSPHLTKLGMKIPDGVKVVIDSPGPRSPVVYIKTEGGTVAVVEKEGALTVLKELPFNKPIKEAVASLDMKVQEFQTVPANLGKMKGVAVNVEVEESLEECEVVLRLPFLDIDNDIFGEIRFGDGEELLVTCST